MQGIEFAQPALPQGWQCLALLPPQSSSPGVGYTGYQTIEAAKEILFRGNVELILFTKGGKGAEAHTKEVQVSVPSQKVKAVDTTGAGDGFIGAFLYKLMLDEVNVQTLPKLKKEQLEEYLKFAHYFCAYSVQREGAISSYPSVENMNIYK